MSLSALVLAAVITQAPADKAALNLYPRSLPVHCQMRAQLARKTSEVAGKRLGDMPRADLHHTVDRRVNGCPVPTIVRYSLEGDGRAANRKRD